MSGTMEGHWVLDEDSGATAYDYSGNGIDGTINGAGPQGTGTVTGPFGNSAYSFDGSNDDIVHSYDTTNLNNPFTWVLWMNGGDSASFELLYGFRDSGTSDRVRFNTNDTGDARLNRFATNIDSTTTVQDGNWHQVVYVYEGTSSGTMKLYVDGEFENEGTDTTSVGSTAKDSLNIGGDSDNSQLFFGGSIADVRHYSRVLSPQEIQYLYQAGVQSEIVFEETQL